MAQLHDPWTDPDMEYEVLCQFVLPAALADFQRTFEDWNALESKALNVLALDAAALAGLVAVRNAVSDLWAAAAIGFAIAAVFLIVAVWPRRVNFGPDIPDYHDRLRGDDELTAARTMVEELMTSAGENDGVVSSKSGAFLVGLSVFSLSLVAALLAIFFRD